MSKSKTREIADQVEKRIQSRVLWVEANEEERRRIKASIFCIVDVMLEIMDLDPARRDLAIVTAERDHLQEVIEGSRKLFEYFQYT